LPRKDAYVARLKDVLKNRIRFSAFDLERYGKGTLLSKTSRIQANVFLWISESYVEFCKYALEKKSGLKNSAP